MGCWDGGSGHPEKINRILEENKGPDDLCNRDDMRPSKVQQPRCTNDPNRKQFNTMIDTYPWLKDLAKSTSKLSATNLDALNIVVPGYRDRPSQRCYDIVCSAGKPGSVTVDTFDAGSRILVGADKMELRGLRFGPTATPHWNEHQEQVPNSSFE